MFSLPRNEGPSNSVVSNPFWPMAAVTAPGMEQTWRPTRQWNLGLGQGLIGNQTQQIKSAITTTLSSGKTGLGAQGIPKPVSNVRITRTPVGTTQFKVSVSFTPDPSDRYFQGVSVQIAQAGGSSVQVVTGKISPITFITNKTALSTAISVNSIGSFANSSSGTGKAASLQQSQ